MGKTTSIAKKPRQVFVRKDTLAFCPLKVPVRAGYELHCYQDAEDIDDQEWGTLNHSGNIFTSLNYLRGLQLTAPPEMSFIYVILRKGKKNLAGYIFQSIHLSVDVLTDVLAPLAKQKSIISHMSEWFTRCREEKGMRVLISGNNFISGEHGVVIAKGADHKEVFSLLPEVVKNISKNIPASRKISLILVKDFYTDSGNKAHIAIRKKRYHAFAVEPEMILEINDDWTSFEDYLSAMSKKYRNRAKAVLKKSSELVQHHLTEEEIRLNMDKLYPLYVRMHEKARFRLAALTPGYFVEMKKRFPGKFAVMMYTLKGKPVAFRTLFLNNNQLEAHFIGVDYALNKEFDLYQRILYDFVDDAIKTSRNQLLLGRTAAEIKSAIGAVAHDFTCYIRHRNSIHNQVIRPFIDYLKPSDWTPRSPFKDAEVPA